MRMAWAGLHMAGIGLVSKILWHLHGLQIGLHCQQELGLKVKTLGVEGEIRAQEKEDAG